MRTRIAATTLTILLSIPASAQWFGIQQEGVPRNADGTVNMSAEVPQVDGHPDLSGLWISDAWNPPGARPNQPPRGMQLSKMLPAAQAEFDEISATNLKDDPKVQCMPNGVPHAGTEPYPFEIIYTPRKTVILYEMYSTRRQVFTDGRELPEDIEEFAPTWMGYSVGEWDGDEFVVTTTGFNDKVWGIDMAGHPSSDALKVIERYKRVDFGHMDLNLTVEDPKTYEEPWHSLIHYTLLPDTDLLEFECEQNRSADHMVGR